MTPLETIIATTFPAIALEASILGDRVVLSTATLADAHYIRTNCDALLPSLELVRAPLHVYLHCSETNTYEEIDYATMLSVGF